MTTLHNGAVHHEKECPDCLGDGSHIVASAGDEYETRCLRCRGQGSIWDADCDCAPCVALCLMHGLIAEDEATDEGRALLAFWKRNEIETTSTQEQTHG